MRIIDIECDIPTREVHEADLLSYETSNDEGMHNYLNIFGPRWAADAGMTTDEFEDIRARLEPIEVRKVIARRAADAAPSEAEFIAMLDEAGIEKACIGTGRHASVEHTLELAARYPDRLIPWGRILASEGMDGVRRLEFLVKERGLKGLEISCFREGRYSNDKKYYPLYAKAIELGVPTRIYSTMSYAADRPMDLGRPLYLDEVCRDFPELEVIAALGGWPWVPEMVGVARRHPNVYIDLAAHRPAHLPKPGSGWEMMLQFANTLLQDRMLFASSWVTLGLTPKQVVDEFADLPIRDDVRGKWMGGNAAKLLAID